MDHFRRRPMADFTKEQLDSIRESEEWKDDAEKSQQNQNQETTVKTLTLAEIEQQLDQQETYWDENNDNYRDSEGFAELHGKGIKTIEQFVKGELELEADAYEKMSEYIKIFLGDYKKEPNVSTYKKAKNKLEKKTFQE